MSQQLKLRRNSVPGKIPTTSSLDFGEIALNTFDGLAFIKKSGSFGEEVISIGDKSGSFSGSFFGTSSWADNAITATQIAVGNVTASVSIDPNNLFLIKSGSVILVNISSNNNVTLYNDLFIIKNQTTQQPVLTVSQSIVQFATHSFNPSGTTIAGSIWFTSSSFYVGLED